MKDMIPIICGPTATGKTKLALELAKKIDGEIISADSRQIYKYLNIGTNKGVITLKDSQHYLDGSRIHIIDFLELDQTYSVYDFQKDAYFHIENILENGKTPIVVGGTGLYIDSLVKNYDLEIRSNSNEFTRDYLNTLNINELQNIALKRDVAIRSRMNQSDWQNPRRLIRQIERDFKVITSDISEQKYLYKLFYPKFDWEILKDRIEARVKEMFSMGLLQEMESILERFEEQNLPGLQTMGYKEVGSYLKGEISLEKCIELVTVSHRQYARRQKTWFEGAGRNYDLCMVDNIDDILDSISRS